MGDCLVSAESLPIGVTIEDGSDPVKSLVLDLFGDLNITLGGEVPTWVKDHRNRNAGQPPYKSGTEITTITISNANLEDIGGSATITLKDFINKTATPWATLTSTNSKNAFNVFKTFKVRLRWKQTETGTEVQRDEVFGNCIIMGDFSKPQGGLATYAITITTDEPYSTFEAVA
jgi:hypothetical protein